MATKLVEKVIEKGTDIGILRFSSIRVLE